MKTKLEEGRARARPSGKKEELGGELDSPVVGRLIMRRAYWPCGALLLLLLLLLPLVLRGLLQGRV
eukprot:6071383-Pyramimonas_sp.AAC.1